MANTETTDRGGYYLVSTPYHCLLALAHAESNGTPAVMFLFGQFSSAADYLRVLRQQPSLLPGLVVEGLTGTAADRRLRRRARGPLLASLERWRPARVVVFNDRHDLSQVALDWARRNQARGICFEDGSSFYTDWLAPPAGNWTRFRKRLTTSRSWEPIRIPGTHPGLHEVRVQRPDAVRPELRGRVAPLSLNLPNSPVLRRLVSGLLSQNGTAPLPDTAPDALLLPALGAGIEWSAAALDLARGAQRLAYKYHPREQAPDPARLGERGDELPRQLPVELLYLFWGGGPGLLIGDSRSTTLLTVSSFDPATRIVGLFRGEPPPQATAYARLGIELCHCD